MFSSPIVVLCFLFGLSASDFMNNDDKTYFLSTDDLKWTDAREACIESGLELASVRSNNERDAIIAFLKDYDSNPTSWYGYWLAGIRYPNGTFYWDTTDIEVGANVENGWLPSEPNDAFHHENCLEMKWDEHNFGWNDFSCDENKPYICQNRRKEDSTGKGLDDYSFLLPTKPVHLPYRYSDGGYMPFIRRSPEGYGYSDLDSYSKFLEKIIQSHLESSTTTTTIHTPEGLVVSNLESVTTTNNPKKLVESNPDYVIINGPTSIEYITTTQTPVDLEGSHFDITTTTANNREYLVRLDTPYDVMYPPLTSTPAPPKYLARSDFTMSTTEKLDQSELEPTTKSTSKSFESLGSRISFPQENSDQLDSEPVYWDQQADYYSRRYFK